MLDAKPTYTHNVPINLCVALCFDFRDVYNLTTGESHKCIRILEIIRVSFVAFK